MSTNLRPGLRWRGIPRFDLDGRIIQYRRVRPLLTDPKAMLTELPEVLAVHQHEHLRQTVCYIASLARRGRSDAKILADLMPT